MSTLRRRRLDKRRLASVTTVLLSGVLSYNSFRESMLRESSGETELHGILSDLTTIGFAIGPLFAVAGALVFILISSRLFVLFSSEEVPHGEVVNAYALSFAVRAVFDLLVSVLIAVGSSVGSWLINFRSLASTGSSPELRLVGDAMVPGVLGILQAIAVFVMLRPTLRTGSKVRTLVLSWLPFALFQASQAVLTIVGRYQ